MYASMNEIRMMSDTQVGRDRRDRYIGNRHINRKRDRQIDKKTDRQTDR